MARLNPDAKKPPNGATKLAKKLQTIACNWNFDNQTSVNPF